MSIGLWLLAAEQVLAMGKFTEAPIIFQRCFSSSQYQAHCRRKSRGTDSSHQRRDRIDRPRRFATKVRDATLCSPLIVKSYKFIVAAAMRLQSHFTMLRMNQRPIIFAGMLLIPAAALRTEVEKIEAALILSQLAETFWVSKALMNQRLRDYLENLN